jgi:hypothetical protein
MKGLILFMVLFLAVAVSAQSSATVAAKQANLRGTPSTNGKIVATVKEGDSLELIKQKGSWYLVQAKDYVGWLHEGMIRLDPPDSIETLTAPETGPPAPEPSDAELKARIEAGIEQLGIHGITVVVKNAQATLTGTVREDRVAVVMKAAMEADVKRVNNKLTVK